MHKEGAQGWGQTNQKKHEIDGPIVQNAKDTPPTHPSATTSADPRHDHHHHHPNPHLQRVDEHHD
jgi:hypothetical protein